MAVNADAPITISAFNWVPPFARGVVRDLRVRWALEEAGLDYAERLFDGRVDRPADYFAEQPFGLVPAYKDKDVTLFESGAIVLHIGRDREALLPADIAERARATAWMFAALNSVETFVQQLAAVDLFHAGKAWAVERRPELVDLTRLRLGRVETHLGDREWLEQRFTAGDLMMTTVLRLARHSDLVAERPRLAAYQARCEARPTFARALAAQMAAFRPENAELAI